MFCVFSFNDVGTKLYDIINENFKGLFFSCFAMFDD